QATWSGGSARPAKRWTVGGVVALGVAGLIVGIWATRHSMTGGATAEPSAQLPDTTPPTTANPPSGIDVRPLEAAPSAPVGAASTTATASVPPRAFAPSRRVAPAPSASVPIASVPIATPPAPPASATKKVDLGI